MVNKATLVGHLGQDPELRYTSTGRPVCNFRIATNSYSGDQKYTEWHRITVWNKNAENCAQHLFKGRQVYVEGSIRTREWTDREGQKRWTTEIHADKVVFLGSPRKQQGVEQSVEQQEAPEANLPSVSEEAQQLFNTTEGPF